MTRQTVACVAWCVLAMCAANVKPAGAQAVSSADREAIVRQHVNRGGRADEMTSLLGEVDRVAAQGLPTTPLVNKIREGIAKNVDAARIGQTVRQMATNIEMADGLLREGALTGVVGRAGAVTLLADAIGSGLAPEAVREIGRQAQVSSLSVDQVAGAAKGLAFITSAKLPVTDGTSVVVEAVRRGYGSQDLVDIGREVKRRERDYQEGRATLRALREAIARGHRPERLFRDPRVAPVERPSVTRPETAPTPERPVRPPVVERPTTPTRPETPERPPTR
jgi:hypothetical protein